MWLRIACACKQGRLRCLGSPSRLKARYGGALALEVQAGAGAAAQAALAAWAAAELGAELLARLLLKPNGVYAPGSEVRDFGIRVSDS